LHLLLFKPFGLIGGDLKLLVLDRVLEVLVVHDQVMVTLHFLACLDFVIGSFKPVHLKLG